MIKLHNMYPWFRFYFLFILLYTSMSCSWNHRNVKLAISIVCGYINFCQHFNSQFFVRVYLANHKCQTRIFFSVQACKQRIASKSTHFFCNKRKCIYLEIKKWMLQDRNSKKKKELKEVHFCTGFTCKFIWKNFEDTLL